MKRILIILVLAAVWCGAQPQTPSLEEKVVALENQISTLQQSVVLIQKQVDEVTRQNLSLKESLHLQTPISEVTAPNGINFRLVSATGNRQAGEITFVFSVMNTTKRDIQYQGQKISFVDQNGFAIGNLMQYATIANQSIYSIVELYPDTPVEMKIIVPHNAEPNFAKVLDVLTYDKAANTRFSNIPIKWE